MASPCVDVYVKLPSGRTSAMLLYPTDSVLTICERIAKEECVESRNVRLKYQGKVLSRAKSIEFLGICAETILKGEIVLPKPITVKIKLPDGRSEDIGTSNTSTVADVKSKLGDLGLGPGFQVLKLGEQHLSADQSMYKLGISDGCELRLDIRKTTSVKDDNIVQEKDEFYEQVDQDSKQKILSSFENANGRNVEVVFSFDTTGSMYPCLSQVRNKLKDCCQRLIRDIPGIHIGLIAHGDYCDYTDGSVLRSIDLTSDTDALVHFAKDAPATGGGDTPECYEWVLRKAQTMDWSEDAAKALVVIGDCEPQYTDQDINWHTELDILKGMGVKVYGVQALDNRNATPFYEELADRTQGCYLKLRHFEAITDMFLAVCYREADSQQLELFVEEVKQEGRMTEDTAAMILKLEQTPADPEMRATRYVKEAWWDSSLCHLSNPLYTYIANEDKWQPFNSNMAVTSGDVVPTATTTFSVHGDGCSAVIKRRRSHKKRMCCLM